MNKAEELAKKIFVPTVGYRQTDLLSEEHKKLLESAKEEFKEDGKRIEVSKLSQSQSEIQDINSSIINSSNALKSFRTLKESILKESDTDNETTDNLNHIEQYLEHFSYKYLEKKENFKNQYKGLI